MKIIKINASAFSEKIIKKTVDILQRGGVIIYPTDTAYALGCDAMNKRACARIFKIKHRQKEKRLPLIAGSVAMVKNFCKVDSTSEKLIKKYWPGALTLILKVKSCKVRKVIGKGETVAVRVPKSKIARAISQRLGRPIVSTSANLSGHSLCYCVNDILRQFVPSPHSSPTGRGDKLSIDLVLDAGILPRKKSSTIIKIVNGKIEILRRGAVLVKK